MDIHPVTARKDSIGLLVAWFSVFYDCLGQSLEERGQGHQFFSQTQHTKYLCQEIPTEF